MFERYTEKARRVIFFARYECSSFGSTHIEPEHLLLGIMRESRQLFSKPYSPAANMLEIRQELEAQISKGPAVSTSVDLPLSDAAKRCLGYGAEEAERLANRFIGSEHLLLGILREQSSLAAQLLVRHGLNATTIREGIQAAGIVDGRSGTETARPKSVIPFSSASLFTTAFAADEAEADASQQIQPQHLLLGLLRQEGSAIAELLAEAGLTAETVRQKLRN